MSLPYLRIHYNQMKILSPSYITYSSFVGHCPHPSPQTPLSGFHLSHPLHCPTFHPDCTLYSLHIPGSLASRFFHRPGPLPRALTIHANSCVRASDVSFHVIFPNLCVTQPMPHLTHTPCPLGCSGMFNCLSSPMGMVGQRVYSYGSTSHPCLTQSLVPRRWPLYS